MVIRRSLSGVYACWGILSRLEVADRAALRGHWEERAGLARSGRGSPGALMWPWGLGRFWGLPLHKDPASLSRTGLSPRSVASRS